MKVDYSGYSAEQLLNDDYFIKSVLHPDRPDKDFWREQARGDARLAGEIETAQNFLKAVEGNYADNPEIPPQIKRALWEKIVRENRRYDHRFKFSAKAFRNVAAASVVLLLGITWLFLADYLKVEKDLSRLENIEQAGPGPGGDVRLLLNKEEISIPGKNTVIEYAEDGSSLIINYVDRVDFPRGTSKSPVRLLVPPGKRSMVKLQDGTQMWVNSGSAVSFPKKFDRDKREIYARGEVYLEVEPDKNRPFIVRTTDLDVEVLGTRFNISAYESDEQVQVVLVDGKVNVRVPELYPVTLYPEQMFSYDHQSGQSTISQVDIGDHVAWKDGYYQFRGQRMDYVLRKISNLYGVSITQSEQLSGLTCSGKLYLGGNIEDILYSLGKVLSVEIDKTGESSYYIH